ncbi:hypothetical protein WA026_006272 [Henosepilachna vigintioctopunctata]|uniref:Uncharacterized protein n=1 Tax=Henosepilachna vigintioctopunctata TaxID=420089 RepID=A0AAW1TPS9_9CUCU
MFIQTLLVLVVVHFTWGYNEDNYPYPDGFDANMNIPEDYDEQFNDFEPVEKRSHNFIRFGRAPSEQEPEPRPARRNDYFVRFGRSKSDYLRFGRDMAHQRYGRSKDNYVRFGRSVPEVDSGTRSKREATSEAETKRNSNYLRFGRGNSDFLRYGRSRDEQRMTGDLQMKLTPEDIKLLKFQQLYDSPLIRLLAQLMSSDREKCKNNL